MSDNTKIPGQPVCGDSDCNSCERWPVASSPAMNTASPTTPVAWCLRDMNGRIVYQNESRANVEMNQSYVKTPTTVDGLVFASLVQQGSATSGEVADDPRVSAISAMLADYHKEVWEAAQSERPDYDYAGRETAKKLVSAIAALAACAEQSNTPVPRVGGNTCEILQIQYANGDWTDVGPRTYAEVAQDGGAARKLYTAPVAERAAAPARVPEGDADELRFNAQRLRNVANLVGLGSAVPHDDATLDGARGAVLGLIAAKLRKSAAPEVAQPAAQGESIDTPEFQKRFAYMLRDEYAGLVADINAWGKSLATPAPTAGEVSARTDESCLPPFAAPASQHSADCPECHGTGQADSGGVHSWGEPAMISCGCDDLRTAVARAIWGVRREEEDRCDMDLEDMGEGHSVWEEADAAIEAASGFREGRQA